MRKWIAVLAAIIAGVTAYFIVPVSDEPGPTPPVVVHGTPTPHCSGVDSTLVRTITLVPSAPTTPGKTDTVYLVTVVDGAMAPPNPKVQRPAPVALPPRPATSSLNFSVAAGTAFDGNGLNPIIIGKLEWDVGEANGWSLVSEADAYNRRWSNYAQYRWK